MGLFRACEISILMFTKLLGCPDLEANWCSESTKKRKIEMSPMRRARPWRSATLTSPLATISSESAVTSVAPTWPESLSVSVRGFGSSAAAGAAAVRNRSRRHGFVRLSSAQQRAGLMIARCSARHRIGPTRTSGLKPGGFCFLWGIQTRSRGLYAATTFV